MAVERDAGGYTANDYRQRAEEMKLQAQRAETVYLQAVYASIADNWERLAAQMSQADRAHKKDRVAENWEEPADDAEEPALPPQARDQDKPSLPRA